MHLESRSSNLTQRPNQRSIFDTWFCARLRYAADARLPTNQEAVEPYELSHDRGNVGPTTRPGGDALLYEEHDDPALPPKRSRGSKGWVPGPIRGMFQPSGRLGWVSALRYGATLQPAGVHRRVGWSLLMPLSERKRKPTSRSAGHSMSRECNVAWPSGSSTHHSTTFVQNRSCHGPEAMHRHPIRLGREAFQSRRTPVDGR